MKEYRYLLDKNIELNYAPNDTSINYKDNTNITSINPILKNNKDLNHFFPSYNTRQFKEEKNQNKLSNINSKYSTCYNYYTKKNYSKYLNFHQTTNTSSLNKNYNNNQQNTTFDDYGGYNKLQTKDLIEITKKRQEIINQQKLKEQEKKKLIDNNLENLNIIFNENTKNLNEKDKNYCDEGVQTSLLNNSQLDNKKEEPVSTIIFTDKSALINQEITFLSIQYSLNNNNKENGSNNSNSSKDYKNTENNDFVNVDDENKEIIKSYKSQDKIKNNSDNDINKIDKEEMKEEFEIISNDNDKICEIKEDNKKNNNLNINNEDDKIKNELEFTIVNNTQNSQEEGNDENNYMTNGQETFKIELNEQNQENKINNNENDNFIIKNISINKIPKVFNDSLEDSAEINNNNIDINKSKSSSNSQDNELTEVEEFDQNLIILQNQSKTMSSQFVNMNNKSALEKEEKENNKNNNNNNILIEDISNNNNDEVNFDSLNDSLSLKNKEKNNLNNNNTKENIFRTKLRKNNSLNKYKDYPNLRNLNIHENNSIYNRNNLTNNDRYQNKNFEEKENEFKKPDLTVYNKDNIMIVKPIKNSDIESNAYLYKPSISNYNRTKNNSQNIKVFSQKKLNITSNENSKINISGIPIGPNPTKNLLNNQKIKNDSNVNYNNINNMNIYNNKNPIIKNVKLNNNNKNYIITPRCVKKKRKLNNYADYFKLKISMSKDGNNLNINNINNNININNNNDFNYNRNYKSLGHQKTSDNWKKNK